MVLETSASSSNWTTYNSANSTANSTSSSGVIYYYSSDTTADLGYFNGYSWHISSPADDNFGEKIKKRERIQNLYNLLKLHPDFFKL